MKQVIALVAMLGLVTVGLLAPAQAALMRVDDPAMTQDSQLALERKVAVGRLKEIGLSDTEVSQRLAKLTPEDFHTIAQSRLGIVKAGILEEREQALVYTGATFGLVGMILGIVALAVN